jgi:hypothetical protein
MLSARGRYVISLDTNGHTNATMVQTEHGDIEYARATDDHRALWYLSSRRARTPAATSPDIEGRTST